MGSFFRKQSTVRMIVIVVALLLLVGLVGGVLAATKTSSGVSSVKTVTNHSRSSSSSSSNSGSSSSNSGSEVSGGDVTQYTLTYTLGEYSDSHDSDKLPDPVTVNKGETVNVDFSIYPAPLDGEKEFVGWSAIDGQSVPEYSDDGTTSITMNADVILYPVYAERQPSESVELTIDNQSSESVEIYYEEDKEEYGNTIISSNTKEKVSIDMTKPYFIRYLSGGSDNRHNFIGTYQGVSGFETEVYYYDGNICAPNETVLTDWSFYAGDGGELLIRDAK